MAKQGRKRPRSRRNERSSGVTSEPLLRRRRNTSALAPNEEHGDRGQHEGGADDGADRDLLGLAARKDRDHGNQRLRQRRTDRGQQASDGSLTEVEAIAGPLDRVREQDRAADDR